MKIYLMKILGNILWLLLGGFATAMEYFAASILSWQDWLSLRL